MKTTLIIMAAGLGTRFGGGIKQLEPVGPGGEIIMAYSIHDAIAAGFDRIIFIIRRDIEEAFEAAIGRRIRAVCEGLGVTVDLAYQELTDLPEGFAAPAERIKPFGTGQAVLACRDMVDGPFAVINADDYYGKKSFRRMHDFLTAPHETDRPLLAMPGYILGSTLSSSGSVTRGVCEVDEEGYLTGLTETRHIVPTAEGAEADGVFIPRDTIVSMNYWGMPASFLPLLREGFREFLASMEPGDLTSEFLLPIFIDRLLNEGRIRVRVLDTNDRWMGVTYKEDLAGVREEFRRFVARGKYREDLFGDLGHGTL